MNAATLRLSVLDRYLTLWIFAAMALGLGLGALFPGLPARLGAFSVGDTDLAIAAGLVVMMYPPLARVEYARLGAVFRDRRVLALSLVLNWLIGPALMFALALVFLRDSPEYMTGVIVIGLARCIAMVLVWNQLAGGSNAYAAGLVAFNSLFQMLFFAPLAWLYLAVLPPLFGARALAVDAGFVTVARAVLTYLGLPFAAGYLTRAILVRRHGEQWFASRFLPRIAPLTLAALLFTVAAMFTLKGGAVLALPFDTLRIAAPLVCYFAIMFAASFLLARVFAVDYPRTASLAFTAASNNFELAIAVAVATFGLASPVAFAAVVGPLVEVPMLVLLVGVAVRLGRRHFAETMPALP